MVVYHVRWLDRDHCHDSCQMFHALCVLTFARGLTHDSRYMRPASKLVNRLQNGLIGF